MQIRSAGIFHGYYKQPEASQDTLTEDGWLRTGDAGFIDRRGHLAIVDRAKDVGRLDDGTPFAPQFVENKLKFSAYIGEAVVFGDGRPFVATMLAIDPNTVGKWAERSNLAYTSFQDLCARARSGSWSREEIRKSMRASPRRRASGASLSSTRNSTPTTTRSPAPARSAAASSRRNTPPSSTRLYGGAAEVELSTEITYEDGRKAVLESCLAIGDVYEPETPAFASTRILAGAAVPAAAGE